MEKNTRKKMIIIFTIMIIIQLLFALTILLLVSSVLSVIPVSHAAMSKSYLEDTLSHLKTISYVTMILELLLFLSSGAVIFFMMIYRKKILDGGKFENMAITDSLTDIYNRRYFDNFYESTFAQSSRYHLPLSLIMCDVDHFKKINDVFGHDIGDIVLKEAASILKDNIRKSDIVARYGGEEFMVCLPFTELPSALDVARKVKNMISKIVIKEIKENLKITVSIGVISYSDKFEDKPDEFIKNADELLYEAKKRGRNRIVSVDLYGEILEVEENPWEDEII